MDVVIIDDDEDLRFATSLALKSGGYTPVAFADCDSAAADLLAGVVKPGVILLDLHLDDGGMPPAAFITWMKSHGFERVPVLVVSGRSDVAQYARNIGAVGHLGKPFEVSQLLDRVAALADDAAR